MRFSRSQKGLERNSGERSRKKMGNALHNRRPQVLTLSSSVGASRRRRLARRRWRHRSTTAAPTNAINLEDRRIAFRFFRRGQTFPSTAAAAAANFPLFGISKRGPKFPKTVPERDFRAAAAAAPFDSQQVTRPCGKLVKVRFSKNTSPPLSSALTKRPLFLESHIFPRIKFNFASESNGERHASPVFVVPFKKSPEVPFYFGRRAATFRAHTRRPPAKKTPRDFICFFRIFSELHHDRFTTVSFCSIILFLVKALCICHPEGHLK